jgi:hypothetical protein
MNTVLDAYYLIPESQEQDDEKGNLGYRRVGNHSIVRWWSRYGSLE